MSSPVLTFRLPDVLVDFPWPRNLSEHYCEAKAESVAWTESFHPFDEEGLRRFNLCDFGTSLSPSLWAYPTLAFWPDLLASLTYSPREKGR